MAITPKVTLLDRAKADYAMALAALEHETDEVFTDMAAYHAHQCAEKCVKFIAQIRGTSYSYQHRLAILLHEIQQDDISAMLEPTARVIDEWENKTRYSERIASIRKDVQAALVLCESLLALAEKEAPKGVRVAGEMSDTAGV